MKSALIKIAKNVVGWATLQPTIVVVGKKNSLPTFMDLFLT